MYILQKQKMDPGYMNGVVPPRTFPKEFIVVQDIKVQFCPKTNNQIAVSQSHHAKFTNSLWSTKAFFAIDQEVFFGTESQMNCTGLNQLVAKLAIL